MSNEILPNRKDVQLVDIEQISIENQKQERQPTWLERLDACLKDEFRFELNKIISTTVWSEVNHGAWNDPIEFFIYLDRQIELVYQLKNKPLRLRSHFQSINPSLQPYPQNGGASKAARENLPIIRQQVFLINALRIIIKKRLKNDQSLRLAFSVLNDLLHQKVVEATRTFGTMMQNPEWHNLANQVEQYSELKDKAAAIYFFLTETIEQNNIKNDNDRRDTLLFMREQMEISYVGITQNNNIITDAFGDNTDLKNLCVTFYYEYCRISALASLEGLQQNDSAIETKPIVQESDELLADVSQKLEKNQSYSPYNKKRILEAAVRMCEMKDKVVAEDIATELRISRKTFFEQIKSFDWNMQTLLDKAEAIMREKEKRTK